MPDGWPNQLKIEVETSRDNQHKLSARDLAGILGHALQRLGYRLTSNPIGVPDILAVWAGRDETAASKTLRRQLQEWMPESEESARLRNVLLSFSDDALQALHRVLRPPEDD
jgi:hypothetical protein